MSIEFRNLSSCNTNLIWENSSRLGKKGEFPSVVPEPEQESPLAEAIRIFRSQHLTGLRELTAEEREEIKNIIEAYLNETGILERYADGRATREDFVALNQFIQELFRQFGASNFYDFVAEFIGEVLGSVANPNRPQFPPFMVEVPLEHAQASTPNRPMLMPFQSPSPHQFLLAGEDADKV